MLNTTRALDVTNGIREFLKMLSYMERRLHHVLLLEKRGFEPDIRSSIGEAPLRK